MADRKESGAALGRVPRDVLASWRVAGLLDLLDDGELERLARAWAWGGASYRSVLEDVRQDAAHREAARRRR